MNLVQMILQMLTPDRVTRIASALGLERSAAQGAIAAAVPALLAAFSGVASKPDGARRLHDAVAQQQPGALDGLMAGVGTSAQRGLVDTGSKLLGSLLGASTTGGLASVIGRFSGVGETAAPSLLGLVGPIVTDALGDQQRRGGLDANGLAGLLSSQKDNIAAAMPSGLTSMLSGAGLFGSLGGALGGMGATAANTVSGMGTAAADAGRATAAQAQSTVYDLQKTVAEAAAAEAARPKTNWLPWALGAAVAAVVAWVAIMPTNRAPDVAMTPTPPAPTAPATVPAAPPAPAATGVTVAPTGSLGGGAADLRAQLTPVFDTMRTSLQDITDPASAQAALPRLQEASAQLDSMLATARQLPAEGRSGITAMLSGVMPGLNEMFDRVLAIPGVAAVAQPVIQGMRARLDELSRA